MRYFFDCEFIDDGRIIDLISIGMVAEDGRELYMVSTEYDEAKASLWVRTHVLNHISRDHKRHTRQEIAQATHAFTLEPMVRYPMHGKEKPEFWAYYADYDWVTLCQLYGPMHHLPEHFPHYCRDIKQEADRLGNPRLPTQVGTNHHALDDARWNKVAFDFLENLKCSRAACAAG